MDGEEGSKDGTEKRLVSKGDGQAHGQERDASVELARIQVELEALPWLGQAGCAPAVNAQWRGGGHDF